MANKIEELLKVPYDDFYKFLVTAGTILFIACLYFVSKGPVHWGLDPASIFSMIVGMFSGMVLSVSFLGVIYGLWKWHKKQKIIDQKDEISLNKDILEYQIIINTLAKGKNIVPGFSVIEKIQKSMVEKEVEAERTKKR